MKHAISRQQHISIEAKTENITKCISCIEQELDAWQVDSKKKIRAMLLAEEILVEMLHCAVPGQELKVDVKNVLGKITIQLKLRGTAPAENHASETVAGVPLQDYEDTPGAEAAIRDMIMRANADRLRMSYKSGVNIATITVDEPTQKNMIYVLLSMFLSAVCCILMRIFVPEQIYLAINHYLFESVKTVFLNAMKMVIAPMVFFSIASCVASITDLRELGKIGGRVMIFYTCTTILAILVSVGIFYGIDPGQCGAMVMSASGTVAEMDVETSVNMLDTVLAIVPNNFIAAFYNSDTLQLIFLAILTGTAAAGLGQRSAGVGEFIAAANDLFLRVASMITRCLPVAVFAFIGSMVLTMQPDTIKMGVALVVCIMLGFATMTVLYHLILLVVTGTNPFSFAKKAFPAWLNAFTLSSSNAAMPYTMEVCDKELGIQPKLYSFSIPLGATINMDGTSVVLMIATLFTAKLYDVPLTFENVIILAVMIALLSFGCPGIPGAGIVCFAMLLVQFGIPMDALAIFISVHTFVDPCGTANNVLGDVAGTYCIGKLSGLMKEQ